MQTISYPENEATSSFIQNNVESSRRVETKKFNGVADAIDGAKETQKAGRITD